MLPSVLHFALSVLRRPRPPHPPLLLALLILLDGCAMRGTVAGAYAYAYAHTYAFAYIYLFNKCGLGFKPR
jgi:hypothetical protein